VLIGSVFLNPINNVTDDGADDEGKRNERPATLILETNRKWREDANSKRRETAPTYQITQHRIFRPDA
jgi:hypothetical protein